MKTVRTVQLIGNGREESGVVEYFLEDRRCHLILRYREHCLEATASDYFAAFCRVREMLEKDGLRPHCYGASLNVRPSAMGRDMAEGLKAYRMTMGEQARMADLVYIFDTGTDVSPASVEEQNSFFEAWMESKRSPA